MVEIKERLEIGPNEIIILASDLTKQEIYQLKQQILQNEKLKKSLEKTIKEIGGLEKYFAMIFCYGAPDKFLPLGTQSYENTTPIPWVNWDEVHAKLQKLLEESKNV